MTLPVLHPGDCRDTLAALAFAGELFDACVTDPPYDLTSVVKRFGSAGAAPAQHGRDGAFARQSRGFMGKQWDGTGVAFDPATWRAVFEVLKPGAYLVAFGGTRTYHRMTCAIEDAGFEIRDCIMWLYGTGFPKSHDVSKAIDAHLGAEREVTGRRSDGRYANSLAISGRRSGIMGDAVPRLAPEITVPATAEAAEWEGWGTALKPAVEPIVLARKPLVVDGRAATVAANVLAHGVGGLNIDGCRIHADDAQGGEYTVKRRKSGAELVATGGNYRADDAPDFVGHQKPGRWPANVVHDGSAEVVAAFPAEAGARAPVRGTKPSAASNGTVTNARKRVAFNPAQRTPGSHWSVGSARSPVPGGATYGDSGSAARFFYSAKASKGDRLCGDTPTKHPTVKPLALMRWLCRLVTPPGGRVLDPFAGSGTTLQAAYEEGFAATGCEMEPDYIADIGRRLARLTRVPVVSCEDTSADELADFLT